MEFQRLKNGWRVFMTPPELKTILESVPHRGCKIAILLMCLSLRRESAAEVVPNDFFRQAGLWWVEVEGKESADAEDYHETRSRNVWVPNSIMEEIQSFIRDENIGDDEPLVWVQKRQLSNWVETAVENAATKTGKSGYERVSCHDFRRFFATHFLLRMKIDPQVVQQLGGWKKIEHMYDYLLMPKDLVKQRLADVGALTTHPLFMSAEKNADTISGNIDTVRRIVQESDNQSTMETVKTEIIALVEEIPSLQVTVKQTGQRDAAANRDSSDEGTQASLQTIQNDDQGQVLPAQLTHLLVLSLTVAVSGLLIFGLV